MQNNKGQICRVKKVNLSDYCNSISYKLFAESCGRMNKFIFGVLESRTSFQWLITVIKVRRKGASFSNTFWGSNRICSLLLNIWRICRGRNRCQTFGSSCILNNYFIFPCWWFLITVAHFCAAVQGTLAWVASGWTILTSLAER